MKKIAFGIIVVILLTEILALGFIIQPISATDIPLEKWFSDGRIAICIHSLQTASRIDYYPYEPDTPGYIWAWVDLSIKNVGSDEISTNSLHAYLKDNQDYMYEGRSVPDDPKHLKLMDLPPGETIRGIIYFEIPPDATIIAFVWHDYKSHIVIPELTSVIILITLFLIVVLLVVLTKKKATTTGYFKNKSVRCSVVNYHTDLILLL